MQQSDKVLLRRYHEQGDLAAREQLIEQYMSLVRSLARRYSYRGEQLEDLVQIGAIGLIKAIDRFDVNRGVELTTYATPNIIGEIKRHFRDRGWSVRVPRGLQELNIQLSRLIEELTVQHGRSPTIPELAKAASVTDEEVLEALESGRAYTSLSLSAGSGGHDEDGELDPLESLGTEEHQYEVSEDRAVLAPGLPRARRARAQDPAPALLRGPDAVADRPAGRHLADARLPADPPLAREDPRRDRGRAVGVGAAPRITRVRTTAELRAGYREFFESKGHEFRPSASLIPRADDRSTLLISAGMQPLMPFFLGFEEPPAPLLTTVQKVFRTPDIDDVGLNKRTLTFFEMLGNFSFGQYFKDGAIELAWEFMFEHMKLDLDRIWVTVFAGDAELGLGEDEVAVRAWEAVGMPPERIVRLPRADNFWSVGGPGPCGPDSEMFFDWGEEVGCGRAECAPGCECDRFLEFWNLVFMEFELHADGSLTPLPKQNIDTGLGLERGARILQQVDSVFDTDGYQEIMGWIAGQSGVAYGESERATKAHRILADHGRGMTFLAVDGVTPSNEGRGYVMRRVIRRAVLQAGRIGLEPPFLAGLAGVVVEQMGEAYPELAGARAEIERVLAEEEQRFGETLARGLTLFEEAAADGEISGDEAFRLHDTYGFPLELTGELARERGLPVDEDRFHDLMEEQRLRSRKVAREVEVRVSGDVRSEFVGYEKTDVLTAILAYEDLGDGRFQAKLEQSPFYPAGGGQVSDSGYIEDEETGARAELRRGDAAAGGRPGAHLRGRGLRRGDARARGRALERPLPDDGQSHRDAPAAQGAAGRARRARAPGRLGGAAGQAALRLQSPAAASPTRSGPSSSGA